MVWVPSVYTSHSYYLATNGPYVDPSIGAVIGVLGFLCIWINYDADYQRYLFRQTKGECTILTKEPTYIKAEYTVVATGEVRTNLLLTSGWWGFSKVRRSEGRLERRDSKSIISPSYITTVSWSGATKSHRLGC